MTRCEGGNSVLVVASGCQDWSGVQASFHLACHCGELLKAEDLFAHHSLEVELHASDSCFPEAPKVWASGRDGLPLYSVPQEMLVDGAVDILGLEEFVEGGEAVLGSHEVQSVVAPDSVWSASS